MFISYVCQRIQMIQSYSFNKVKNYIDKFRETDNKWMVRCFLSTLADQNWSGSQLFSIASTISKKLVPYFRWISLNSFKPACHLRDLTLISFFVILFILMNLMENTKTNLKHKFFVVLSPSGNSLSRIPFLSRTEKHHYEERLRVASQMELMAHQQKMEEESTHELEFEPFVPIYAPFESDQ